MKNKTTQSVCTKLGILWILVILTGCSQPILHNRPSDASCKDYLSGRQILLEKGRFFDTTWTIKSNEFSKFSMTEISKNADGSKNAKVRFELNDRSKTLRVEGTINYRVYEKDGVLKMLSFTPERVIRLGKW